MNANGRFVGPIMRAGTPRSVCPAAVFAVRALPLAFCQGLPTWPLADARSFQKLPGVLHPIVRGLLFKRVLRKVALPKAKTNKAMNPVSGPATLADGRIRLETAHQTFAEACRQAAAHGERMRQPSSAPCR